MLSIGRHRAARALPALIALFLLQNRGIIASPPLRVLGDDGAIYEWVSNSRILRPAPPPLSMRDLGGTVNDLASDPDGLRTVLLTANPKDAGKGRKRLDGQASVFDTSIPTPRLLHEIPHQGEGFGVVITGDARRAYIVAARLKPPRGGPRFWIHALDLEAGRVTGSILLDRVAVAIAIDPRGERVFVSQEERIQTFTTQPLVTSWFFRSPGTNGRLFFPPDRDVLHVVRERAIAQFDPAEIRSRARQGGRTPADDATAGFDLPSDVSTMRFSDRGRLAVALGAASITFLDLSSGSVLAPSSLPAVVDEAGLIRPLAFPERGNLLVGVFPAGIVASIAPPAAPPPEEPLAGGDPAISTPAGTTEAAPIAAAPPLTDPEFDAGTDSESGPAGPDNDLPSVEATQSGRPTPSAPQPESPLESDPVGSAAPGVVAAEERGSPAPVPDPVPHPVPAPVRPPDANTAGPMPATRSRIPKQKPAPAPIDPEELYLAGRLSGALQRVAAIAIYGPDNIIREHDRVGPGGDGGYRFPLPPAGTYRLVPIGDGSRVVVASPNFRTVVVRPNEPQADLDFSIREQP